MARWPCGDGSGTAGVSPRGEGGRRGGRGGGESRSGEQGDALVPRVLAFQEEKRTGVSPPGKPIEDSGPGQPGSNLFRVESAEEKISGVLARQFEEEFAFRRGRAGP